MILLPALALAVLPQERLALEGATVHSMLPDEPPRVATVLIEDGRVAAVAPDLELEPGVERVDLTGKHLVPSLLDGYVNFDAAHDPLYAVAGVSLVRDVGGDRARLLLDRQPERRERILGPDLFSALAVLDGDPPATSEAVVLRDPPTVDALLPILLEDGVDFLSIYQGLQPDVWQRVIERGHEADLEVWGPLPRQVSLDEALAAGQDGIHFLDRLLPPGVGWEIVQEPALRNVAKQLAEAGTTVIPMLHPSFARLHNQEARPGFGELLALLSPRYEVWWRTELAERKTMMTEPMLELGQRIVEKQFLFVRVLHEEGVNLLPGSGSPQPWLFPGQALHQELALWVTAGIPAPEVLALATRGAAETLGLEEERGTIRPGMRADLIVADADPRENLATLVDPHTVVVRGELLDRAARADALDGLLAAQRALREELARPLELEPPPGPEGSVVLDGRTDVSSFGHRISAERFRIIRRAEDDALVFLGRVLTPRTSIEPEREILVAQVLGDGGLAELSISMRQDEHVLEFQGLWIAGTWRMRRTLDGKPLGTTSSPTHPAVADVGSVTTFLVIGQLPLSGRFPVLAFHAALTPELANWSVELDEEGNHQVRTHLGRMAFRLDEVGAPERAISMVGRTGIQTDLIERDAFGGPGLPLPAEKLAAIRERREAAEASGPTRPEGEDAAAVGEGGGETQDDAPAPEEPDEPDGDEIDDPIDRPGSASGA